MTYKTLMRLDDDLAAEVKAYATEYHVSIADAIRILLIKGLKES